MKPQRVRLTILALAIFQATVGAFAFSTHHHFHATGHDAPQASAVTGCGAVKDCGAVSKRGHAHGCTALDKPTCPVSRSSGESRICLLDGEPRSATAGHNCPVCNFLAHVLAYVQVPTVVLSAELTGTLDAATRAGLPNPANLGLPPVRGPPSVG